MSHNTEDPSFVSNAFQLIQIHWSNEVNPNAVLPNPAGTAFRTLWQPHLYCCGNGQTDASSLSLGHETPFPICAWPKATNKGRTSAARLSAGLANVRSKTTHDDVSRVPLCQLCSTCPLHCWKTVWAALAPRRIVAPHPHLWICKRNEANPKSAIARTHTKREG